MAMITFYSAEPICTYVSSQGELVSFFDNKTTIESDSLAAAELRKISEDMTSPYSLKPRDGVDTSVSEEIKKAAAEAKAAELAAVKK